MQVQDSVNYQKFENLTTKSNTFVQMKLETFGDTDVERKRCTCMVSIWHGLKELIGQAPPVSGIKVMSYVSGLRSTFVLPKVSNDAYPKLYT